MAQGIVSFHPDEAEVEIEELLDSGYEIVSLATVPTSSGSKVMVVYAYDLEEEEDEYEESDAVSSARL